MDDLRVLDLTPFSLRHRRLLDRHQLPQLPDTVRVRLWRTLEMFNEPFLESSPHSSWTSESSDLEQVTQQLARLLGIELPWSGLPERLQFWGEVALFLDFLEAFSAWVDADAMSSADRGSNFQREVNRTFQDFHQPWRMVEGRIFQVDDAYLEDEILSDAAPLLASAEFKGAHDEFLRARDLLVDGNARDAIFYAHASVESSLIAASGASSKVGVALADAYANAGLMAGLSKSKGQAVARALMPTATLRNELGGHGQGVDKLDVPLEYGTLAVGLAAVVNTFLSQQHLARLELARPSQAPPASTARPHGFEGFDDDDIPW